MNELKDYNDLFNAYDAVQSSEAAKYPKCCLCGKTIFDEYLYDIMDAIYCEDCMKKNYREYTDRYIKEDEDDV
jgi:predicted GIY-YIG superfamily endonuclease